MKDDRSVHPPAPSASRPPDPPPGARRLEVGPGAPADENAGALARVSLFSGDAAQAFRTEWGDVQRAFVDAPRGAVEKAAGLVGRVTDTLVKDFGEERRRLEETWVRGGDVSTEELRIALQRYRSFFDRLLSV